MLLEVDIESYFVHVANTQHGGMEVLAENIKSLPESVWEWLAAPCTPCASAISDRKCGSLARYDWDAQKSCLIAEAEIGNCIECRLQRIGRYGLLLERADDDVMDIIDVAFNDFREVNRLYATYALAYLEAAAA